MTEGSKKEDLGQWLRSRLPRHRILRILLGVLLVIGGIFGWLPAVGFWMIPLGVIVLSVDIPAVRRFRRKIEVKWGRRRQRRAAARKKGDGSGKL